MHAFSVHAHFYQPPREDPRTGVIPIEGSAAPFPNWNERIHAECYRPNAELRNFERISFNIGPTLHGWMAASHSETSRRIIEQDRANVQRHGVGNAIAQAYNHTILPLATYQDKVAQIYWGLADFEHHYGRKAQGMWLPETAVDSETLEIMARFGLQFTILAPWQAEAEHIDSSEPYRVDLPGGQQITVFFYQSDLSGQISFSPDVTINADRFAESLLRPRYNSEKTRNRQSQILLIASDGELYGHHQLFRDRFLARLVDGASSSLGLESTYPALWLKHNPPRQATHIREQTSWSCHHGVGRWNGRCACTPGTGEWKVRLRRAFDRLAAEMDALYLEATQPLFKDPWQLRNRYIHVWLGQMSLAALLSETTHNTLTSGQVRRISLLLEAQRERQRMFTSCGWFFEDLDRIEPKNNLAYAAQAVRLARLATGVDLAPLVVEDLRGSVSTKTRLSAVEVFEKHLTRG
jgi:hypothetical protein